MDVTFTYFCQQIFSSPALLITSVLTLGVIFVNGWTDAPNAIATCITTRCMRPRPAIIMSAIFNFLGVLIMTKINASVASTISNMVDFGSDTQTALIALSAALFSIVVYSTGASHFGIPLSTTHVISTAIMGVGSTFHAHAVKWRIVGNIVIAWVLTIPACMIISSIIYYLIYKII